MFDALREFRKYWGGQNIIVYITLDDGMRSMWAMTGLNNLDIITHHQTLRICDKRGFLDIRLIGTKKYSIHDMNQYVPLIIEQINERFIILGDVEFIDAHAYVYYRN